MTNLNVIPIFPTPVLFSKLNREFTKQELSFIEKTKNNTVENSGNRYSDDTYILNNPILTNLKNEIMLNVRRYADYIICPEDNIEFFITQSWLNYTLKKGYHPVHNHPNSILSGVLYIKTFPEKDEIVFHKKDYEAIKFDPSSLNMFNSNRRHLKVNSKDLIIFPSSLDHSVPIKDTDFERISLAFNVFFKGKINSAHSLYQLDNSLLSI